MLIALIPSASIWASQTFQQVMVYTSQYINFKDNEIRKWTKKQHEIAFTFSSWKAKIITVIVVFLILATLTSVNPIYSSSMLKMARSSTKL